MDQSHHIDQNLGDAGNGVVQVWRDMVIWAADQHRQVI